MARSTLHVPSATEKPAAGTEPGRDGDRLEPLPFEEILTAGTFGEYNPLVIAPDRRSVAYTVRRARTGRTNFSPDAYYLTGVPWFALGADIWLTDLNSTAARRLTEDEGNNWLPTWSPDGRHLVFCSDRPEPGNEERFARLWLWEASSGEQRLLADVNVRSHRVAWSPDGRRLLAGVLPEGITPQAYAARARSAAATLDEPSQEGATVRIYQAKPRTDPNQPVSGVFDLDREPVDLVWIDVESGLIEPLTRDVSISTFRLSPDGKHVAYSCPVGFEQTGSQQMLFTLNVVGEGDAPKVIAEDIRLSLDGSQFAWAPNSEKLAYRALGSLADGEVYVVGREGGDATLITSGEHRNFTEAKRTQEVPLWDDASKNVYFVDDGTLWRASTETRSATEVAMFPDQTITLLEQREGMLLSHEGGAGTVVFMRHKGDATCGFLRIGLDDGAVTPIQVERKSYGGYAGVRDGLAVSTDGRLLIYAAQDTGHGPDLYSLALDEDGSIPRRLTTINPTLEGYVMGETRVVDWRTIDGGAGRGILLLPAGYEEGRRYPMITKVYGGSKPSERAAGYFGLQVPAVDNLQLFATRGFAVLLPDIPLEDDKNEGTVVSDLIKTVLPGVDKVVEMGIADPERLGLTGHSFGGYNTISMLTRTTRFRAAMMSAGLANLISAYGEMADDGRTYGTLVIEHGQFLVHGTPWEIPARYIENSPIFHLDRVQTPLLIIHGGADEGVAPFLADEIFVGLRRLGKEVVYAKYEGEGHHQAQWSLANQLDYWRRTVAFFDKHLESSADNQSSDHR